MITQDIQVVGVLRRGMKRVRELRQHAPQPALLGQRRQALAERRRFRILALMRQAAVSLDREEEAVRRALHPAGSRLAVGVAVVGDVEFDGVEERGVVAEPLPARQLGRWSAR